MNAVIETHGLRRIYGTGQGAVHALADFTLTVEQGEFLAIMGASGSGKSTAMNILGCLDIADSGTYLLDGVDVSRLSQRNLALVRNRKIGFVFQSFNLMTKINALRNVELPMAYAGVSRTERRKRAMAALDLVGLGNRVTHLPSELSGGQAQRVAVARALVNAPALILADEPTGNLDSTSATDVLGVFKTVHAAGRTVVLITHDADVAAQASRVVHMRDGRIVSDTAQPGPFTRATARAVAQSQTIEIPPLAGDAGYSTAQFSGSAQ
ncbi:MAG: ABC transporter ATP-binding protein [Bifidobacteriaceae bacterium]|jgi:putative ABC transport system ATP-binding protein|nr:ABC transporter ATP-binding protein [Bifidobacteriaceae bacterium]